MSCFKLFVCIKFHLFPGAFSQTEKKPQKVLNILIASRCLVFTEHKNTTSLDGRLFKTLELMKLC